MEDRGLTFAIAQQLLVGSSLVAALVSARWVQPSELGLWRVLALAEVYSVFFTFGIPNAFLREYPIQEGRGARNLNRYVVAMDAAFATQSLLGLLSLAYVVLAVLPPQDNGHLRLGVISYIVFFVTTRLKVSSETFLRARGDFSALSRCYVVLAVSKLASVGLVPVFGVVGFLIRWPITSAIEYLVLERRARQVSPERGWAIPEWGVVRGLARDGIPLIVISAVGQFDAALDRQWLSTHATLADVGRYFVADCVKMFYSQAFASIALVYYYRCGIAYGREDAGAVRRAVFSGVRMNLVVYVSSLAAVVLFMPQAVRVFMPNYVGGTQAALVIGGAGVFAAVASGGFVLTVTRAYGWCLFASFSGITAQLAAQHYLGTTLPPAVMVATAWAIGQAVVAVAIGFVVVVTLRRWSNGIPPAPAAPSQG